MGRGGKVWSDRYAKRRPRSKDKGSDDSDEDYTLGGDEEFDDSEEYCSSLAGEESEESLVEFEEDEEEEKVRKVGRSKGKTGFLDRKKSEVGKAPKKTKVSHRHENDDEDYQDEDYDDDEEEEEEEEEEKVRKIGRSKGKTGFLDRKRSEVGKAPKKTRVSYRDENDDEDYQDKDYDDDDEEEEEEDDHDEEFTPDEFDLDDEDELAVRKKNKKVVRHPLPKRGFVTGRKRKRNSKVMRKKSTKSCGLQRKSAAANDGAFIEKNPVVKKRSEKSSSRRKRRFMADYDSDFMSSGSSDVDFTISEEEREQVREASEFCGDLTPILRNSSPKKGLEDKGVLCQQKNRQGRKGKEKVEDLKNEAGKQVCGICFSEEEKKTIRGTLNCCSHYFCFTCIMEWSKVESRCPLCKQRFLTISKPTGSNTGIDLRTTVVQIPERDQVYQPSEEELRGYLDPYENVICTECQQGGDDALMLLCDLCDSPAHTFCVGLGREVPVGNWYCEGCRPTALGSSNPQAPSPTPNQRSFNGLSGRSSPVENVRESIDLNAMYVPETPLTQGNGVFSSPRWLGEDFRVASPLSGSGVATVSERRRVNRMVHSIRRLRTRMPDNTLGNNFFLSQIERLRELGFQGATAPETLASHQTFLQGRLQGDFSPSVQSRDLFPARSSHSRSQIIQDQTSTSADRSANGMLQAGIAGIGVGISSRLGYEQLYPCYSRSSIGDSNTSSRGHSEAALPSRTSQGVRHTPFWPQQP